MSQAPLWADLQRTTGRGSVDRLERYYTPDPLAQFCLGLLPWSGVRHVLEPHAGGGAFVRAAAAYDVDVRALDLDQHSRAVKEYGAVCADFLADAPLPAFDRVVGNPPFSNAEQHVQRALEIAPQVAFLMPLDRLESRSRYAFWQAAPLRHVWVLSERVWAGSRCIAWFWWDREWSGVPGLQVVSHRAAP